MSKNVKISLIIIGIAGLLSSCGSTAPLLEKEGAAKSIALAKSVESEKFAPQEYKTAVSEYEAGEELINLEKKSKDNDKARDKYIESSNQAISAYNNSVGPYIEQFIFKTEEEIEKARAIKTDVVKKEQFDQAVSLNQQSKETLENKNYEQAKLTSLEAYDIIKQAYEETLELRNQADLLDQKYAGLLNELRQKKAEAAVPEEYKTEVANYDSLQARFQEGYYEEIISAYNDGILSAQDLLDLIEEKRLLAKELLEEAEHSIEVAKEKVQKASIDQE